MSEPRPTVLLSLILQSCQLRSQRVVVILVLDDLNKHCGRDQLVFVLVVVVVGRRTMRPKVFTLSLDRADITRRVVVFSAPLSSTDKVNSCGRGGRDSSVVARLQQCSLTLAHATTV